MPAAIDVRARRRRWLCPQVVQTSQMDCGPAAAKALLEGCGRRASYGRLRELCQTDVDGTAIGDLDALINRLGLPVEEVMVPVDHVLATERQLPSIAVVEASAGQTHLVVAWRRHGRWLQVMDPAVGRRFVPLRDFERQLYQHQHEVDAAAWRQWAATDDFTAPLALRLGRLGIESSSVDSSGAGPSGAGPSGAGPSRLINAALDDPSWRSIAALDAAARLAAVLAEGRALPEAEHVESLVRSLAERAAAEIETEGIAPSIPERFWSVWPTGAGSQAAEDGEAQLFLRGAVLLRPAAESDIDESDAEAEPEVAFPEPAMRAIEQGDVSPWSTLLRTAGRRARRRLAAVAVASGLAAAAVVLEALLLFGLIHAAGQLQGLFSLLFALAAVLVVVLGVTALDLATTAGAQQLGRHLELRLRTDFLRKIPRLGDRFLASRLRSDMAERAHSVAVLRTLPPHLADLVGLAAGVATTTLGLALLFPDSAGLVVLLAAVSLLLPLAAQSLLREPATALREHAGGLSSYYLDTLRGLTAIRACGGESSLRAGHEAVLESWLDNALSFNRRAALIDSLQGLAGFGLAASIVILHVGQHGLGGGVLLLTYWALSLPELGAALAQAVQQLPNFAAIAGRFAEPMQAPEPPQPAENAATQPTPAADPIRRGPAMRFDRVSVVAGGRPILHEISAEIRAGERVAILGASGAGKTTLLGLLLGWQQPASGSIEVDGSAFDVPSLRERTAWLDPSVTLWNRSLLANLRYGARASPPIDRLCQAADLREAIAGLPAGLATELGEEGGYLSSGEGQRTRFARALGRPDADLVILDEPFRGLERTRRGVLLERAMDAWRGATILCATHDVTSAGLFDRVLMLEAGRLVEIGAPGELREQGDSRYSRLLEAEARRQSLWDGRRWTRWSMHDGRLESRG